MPSLKDEREERYCVNLVCGMEQIPAAKLAGYKGSAAQAHIVYKRPRVQTRLAELKEQIAKRIIKEVTAKTIMELDERKERLTAIAREDIRSPSDTPLRDPNIKAIDILNKIDHIYTDTPAGGNDNRQYNIYISGDEAKQKLMRLLAGEKRIDGNGS